MIRTPMILMILVASLLCACSSEQAPEAAKAGEELTVEYLVKNESVLTVEDNRCNSLPPVEALKDPVCQNVLLAKKRHLSKGYLDKGPASKKVNALPEPK